MTANVALGTARRDAHQRDPTTGADHRIAASIATGAPLHSTATSTGAPASASISATTASAWSTRGATTNAVGAEARGDVILRGVDVDGHDARRAREASRSGSR